MEMFDSKVGSTWGWEAMTHNGPYTPAGSQFQQVENYYRNAQVKLPR